MVERRARLGHAAVVEPCSILSHRSRTRGSPPDRAQAGQTDHDGMRILSVHHSVPDTRITNDVVLGAIRARNEHRLDEQEMAAVEQRIGAQLALAGTDVRYIAPDGENVLDHVLAASRRALEDGGVRPEEVDFVIYTGIGRGWLEPASANVVQHALGLTNATGFDLLDACASWVRALQVAHSFVEGSTAAV